MELVKKNIHMDCMKSKAATQVTLEEDMNVSDNKPDVSKLIFDKGVIQIEEVKVTADHVQVGGKLLFTALYISEEEDKKVCTIEGSVPFKEQVYMEGVQNGDSVTVKKELEDLTIDLINSRKLSVKAVINLQLCVESLFDEETAVDVAQEDRMSSSGCIEYKKKSMEISELAIQTKDVFRIKEEIQIPQNLPNIFEILWEDVTMSQLEFRPQEENISVQGELCAFFLYESEGEEQAVRFHEVTIPFAGSVECHGSKENYIPDIDYAVSHMDVEVRPDFDGEERVIGLEMVLDLQIKLYAQEQIEILSDVYGVQSEVNTTTKNGAYKNLLIRNSGKTKIGDHIRIKSDAARILQLCHSEGEAQTDEVRLVENGIEVAGSVPVKVLYVTNEDAMPLCSVKGVMPFKYMIDVPHIQDQCDINLNIAVEQIAVTMINSEEIDVRVTLNVGAVVFCTITEKIITDIQVSELDSSKLAELPGIVVYIAKEGDSLWEIGKKYYMPIAQIKESNGLTSDALKAGDKLMVVKSLGR